MTNTNNTIRVLALAVLATLAGAASASTVTLAAGAGPITVSDPLGSGRTSSIALVSGSGTLSFSSGLFDGVDVNTIGGLIGALNVGNVTISSLGSAAVNETALDGVRVSSAATAQVTGVALDDVSGRITTVGSVGGALQTGTFISGTLTGGAASVTNLRFNLEAGTVTADLYGIKAPVGTKSSVVYDLPSTVLWTFDPAAVTGPTSLKPEYLLAADPIAALTAAGFSLVGQNDGGWGEPTRYRFVVDNVISNLMVTTAGYNFFRDSLGLLTTGQNALKAVNNDLLDADGNFVAKGGYGSVSSRLVFEVPQLSPSPVQPIPGIPEPSTYALMGLGLVGVILASRRAKRH